MQAAARGLGWPRSDPFSGRATGAPRKLARPEAGAVGELAPEIAFLAAQDYAPGVLRQAQTAARRDSVSAQALEILFTAGLKSCPYEGARTPL